jgi:lipoprotein-anchoring transpeptidase ErfK/SrfK
VSLVADRKIEISLGAQSLVLSDRDGRVLLESRVSTARNGAGERMNSECTPRGRHVVRAKIGTGQPANTVLVSRRPTGEVYSPALRAAFPGRDWILTRILWLSGLEPGRNRLGDVDTMRRYVYIHGCPDEDPMGVPSSRGCVKMRNPEVIRLFDLVSPGTPVLIKE